MYACSPAGRQGQCSISSEHGPRSCVLHVTPSRAASTRPEFKARLPGAAAAQHVPQAPIRLALLQDCWEGLEQVVRLAWAAHCEARLQAAVDQLRVADSRADDSASEVQLSGSVPARVPVMAVPHNGRGLACSMSSPFAGFVYVHG